MSFLPYAYLAAYSFAAGQKSISVDDGSSLQKWSIVSTLQKYKSPYFYCFAAAVTIVGTVGIVGIGTWSLA